MEEKLKYLKLLKNLYNRLTFAEETLPETSGYFMPLSKQFGNFLHKKQMQAFYSEIQAGIQVKPAKWKIYFDLSNHQLNLQTVAPGLGFGRLRNDM